MKKYTIEYYDRETQKIVYKEYESKFAFIKRLKKVSTADTYTITIDGKEIHDCNMHIIYALERGETI